MRGIFGALIGMTNCLRGAAICSHRLVHGSCRQLRTAVLRKGPAEDLAAVQIHHHTQIGTVLTNPDKRHVTDPNLIN